MANEYAIRRRRRRRRDREKIIKDHSKRIGETYGVGGKHAPVLIIIRFRLW